MAADPKIVSKIQKLLNLGGNNPSEKEAASAFAKAAQLAEEHGLSLSDMNQETGEVTNLTEQTIGVHKSNFKVWMNPLAVCIAKCFECNLLVSKKEYLFLGAKTDVEMCLWYFKSTRLRIIMQGKKKFRLVADQRSYGFGAYSALSSRLNTMFVEPREQLRSQNTRDLVVMKKDQVDEFMHKKYPNIRKGRRMKAPNSSAKAFSEGYDDGNKMNLHRGEINV